MRRWTAVSNTLTSRFLVDGLRAEREQGITIDVAYRYFATPKRTFVLADTPGHVQYTRNTVSGASTAQLVILLVDARKASSRRLAGTQRFSRCSVSRSSFSAVNKIDSSRTPKRSSPRSPPSSTNSPAHLAGQAKTSSRSRCRHCTVTNVAIRSDKTPYYTGPTLIEHLESIPVDAEPHRVGLRFPVQYVIRPRTAEFLDYRGYAGQVAAGSVVPATKW